MSRFTHIHSSSRFDRSLASLKSASQRYFADADLVTFTEVAAEGREDAVRVAGGDEWRVIAGDNGAHNDCVIAFKKVRFELLYRESFKASERTFYNSRGNPTTSKYATNAVLLDKSTNKKFVLVVVHLPASVEDDLRIGRKTQRTLYWFSAFLRTKARGNLLRRRHKAAGVVYVADFNVNFKRDWVRRLIRALAPAYGLMWRAPFPAGGTHHDRLIDGTLIKGDIRGWMEARLYPDDSSSDHRPYIEGLRLTA